MLVDATGTPFPPQQLNPAAFSAYVATQESSARGHLITFAPDTRQQLTPWVRTTLLLKSRTLVENYGPAKALWHLARLIGSLKPQSRCEDTDWGKLAEARFAEITQSPLIFDAGGRFTLATLQTFCTFRRFTDGDIFSIFTETTTKAARIATREAHQVRTPEGSDPASWIDGVRADSNGFPLAYGFDQGDGIIKQLPNSAVHHHATFTTMGSRRGTPALAHFINDAHDLMEIKGFVKHAIKTASRMGLTRKSDTAPSGMPPGLLGSASAVETSLFQSASPTSPTATVTKSANYEDVFGAGVISAVPLDTLHDDRPSPNQQEFKRDLLRECAIGLGVSPNIMFFLEDKSGANTRVDLDMFAKFVLDQHANYQLPFCQRFWSYAIGKEMAEGRLPYPSKGDYWKVRWTPPRSLTADLGKMGNLLIALRKSLLTTYASHYEEMGLYYEDELEQAAKEAAYLIELESRYQLPPGTLLSALSQQNAPATPAAAPRENDPKPEPEPPSAD